MKKFIINLGINLGIILVSVLYATIWTIILSHNFNYRVIRTNDGGFLFTIMFICFYHLGVYLSAATFGLFFKRKRNIASSSLSSPVYIFIILLSNLLILSVISFFFIFSAGSYVFYIYLGIILLFLIVTVRLVYNLENTKSSKHLLRKIAPVLLISLILLLVVCINDFPGVNASIEVRQEWAYKKFPGYSGIVNGIEKNNEITDKVGQIKFVAPTKGRNLLVAIGGSSGPSSELTLEVVGEKGKGIAYICTWGGHSGITGLSFEYQGKKTKRWGLESCG